MSQLRPRKLTEHSRGDQTTIVVVTARAARTTGLGYSYADLAIAALIDHTLGTILLNRSAVRIRACWSAMLHAIRNLERPGISSMAVAAADNALWDLKARLLRLPVVTLLGQIRDAVPVYGSGGFTSYSVSELRCQLENWVKQGIGAVKISENQRPMAIPPASRLLI